MKAEEGPSESSQGDSSPPSSIRWWHWLWGGGLWALFLFLSPVTDSFQFAQLTEGSISPIRVIAPFDFEIIKSEEELERERREAARKVLPIFKRQDSAAMASLVIWQELISQAHKICSASHFSSGEIDQQEKLRDAFNQLKTWASGQAFTLPKDTALWWALIKVCRKMKGGELKEVGEAIEWDLRNKLLKGVIDTDKEEELFPQKKLVVVDGKLQRVLPVEEVFTISNAASEAIRYAFRDREELSGEAIGVLRAFVEAIIKPNLIYQSEETEKQRLGAISSVPLAKGVVKKDELIVDRHIRITPEIRDKLRSLDLKRWELRAGGGGRWWLIWVGRGMVLLILVIGLGWFIKVFHSEVWGEVRLASLLGSVWALFHIFQRAVVDPFGLWFLLPAGAVGMLLVVIGASGVAVPFIVAMALVSTYLAGYVWWVGMLVVVWGLTGVIAAKGYQSRREIVRGSIPLVGVGLGLGGGLYFLGAFDQGEALRHGLSLFASGVATPALVLGLGALGESLFRITTNLKLMELVDLNQPLLRQLADKAPGTYHHSLLLGGMAEAAARAIGANAILTRAGAYYHDIGKMDIREYFIENQLPGEENIHDSLPPETSAQWIVEHVRRGIELAKRYKLPHEIIDFIPEHHGTSRLAFFYDKARKVRGKRVEERQFRYPGPKPRRKETAIVMLADTVEAASHSLENPTLEEVSALVENLFRVRIDEGELNDSPLTFKDIEIIKRVFVQSLMGALHQRVQYPPLQIEEVKAMEEVNKGGD